jgi:hypothetical protein
MSLDKYTNDNEEHNMNVEEYKNDSKERMMNKIK